MHRWLTKPAEIEGAMRPATSISTSTMTLAFQCARAPSKIASGDGLGLHALRRATPARRRKHAEERIR